MSFALKKVSAVAVSFLFFLTLMVVQAAPALAVDWRTEGPFIQRSECQTIRGEFRRYYSRVGVCYYDSGLGGFWFNYDRDSGN